MKRYSLYAIAAVLLTALVWVGCSMDRGPVAPNAVRVATKPAAGVAAVTAVQDRHTDILMDIPGVLGTATGLRSDGSLAIKVLTKSRGVAGIPADLEGVPVEVEVTGNIVAFATTDPTTVFPRPVPTGVSTGNINECAAGTIGARVKDGAGNVYALSNNHVYARENKASIGELEVQPGNYDAVPQCTQYSDHAIGTLAKFVKIVFRGNSTNRVDAAIAVSSILNLSNSTLPDGYLVPSSTPVPASLSQKVQKYGRTTGLTKGTVSYVNLTVKVQYSSGIARFVGQIGITPGGFSAAGDSGSLIVTDDLNANPVGLLFAGSSTLTIANQIQDVLSALGVSIDGK